MPELPLVPHVVPQVEVARHGPVAPHRTGMHRDGARRMRYGGRGGTSPARLAAIGCRPRGRAAAVTLAPPSGGEDCCSSAPEGGAGPPYCPRRDGDTPTSPGTPAARRAAGEGLWCCPHALPDLSRSVLNLQSRWRGGELLGGRRWAEPWLSQNFTGIYKGYHVEVYFQ